MRKKVFIICLLIISHLYAESAFKNIGNPYERDYKNGEMIYARNIWDMQLYQDKIYLGAGNSSNEGPAQNAGRLHVVVLDPMSDKFAFEYEVAEEQIDLFKTYGDTLYIPGHDATQNWILGNIYTKKDGMWKKIRTLPKALHVYDLVVFDEKIFTAVGLNKNGAVFISNPHADAWKQVPHAEGRVYSFLQIGEELFATKTFKTKYRNKLSMTQYKKNLNTFSARFDLDAFKMFPDTKLKSDSIKLGKSISYENKALYLGVYKHNDHQNIPFGVYLASMQNNKLDVKKINLKDDYTPRDILHRDNFIYILVNQTEKNRENIKVLKFNKNDFSNYKEIIEFQYNSFARSFEEINGCFYFGIGSEIKDPDAWNQNELKKETGDILKSCVQ
ncbi:MAG: hypothetical protein RBT59_09015 [Arcobacteraceae bacterium]|jgi:hypothetical protein|nr:hypothetical protein [Arcobacteraceae bacterium]